MWRRHILKLPGLYAATLPPVNHSFFSLSHLSTLIVCVRVLVLILLGHRTWL